MTYKELFAEIYIKYGKKNFQDGPALLELVKKVDPEISPRQYTVIDYLTRQNNIAKLMEVRFAPAKRQEETIVYIAQTMNEDYFIPFDQTEEAAKGFLAVFQHGSRKEMNEIQQEYDESEAPTVIMEPIKIDNDSAPVLDTYPLNQAEELSDDEQPEEEVSGDTMVFAQNPLASSPEVIVIDKDEEGIDYTPKYEDESVQVRKPKKVKGKKAKKIQEVKEEKPSSGRLSTILLVILFILLFACIAALLYYLKKMNIL